MPEKNAVRRLGRVLSFRLSYLERLFSGEKSTTIRRGIVQPLRSEVYLESNGKIYGEARVKSLRFTRVADLTDEDAKKDGFNSRKDLLDALREIYPDIKDEDWVTIISLDNITRYSSPVKTEGLKSSSNIDTSLVARLSLAHGLPESQEHRAILARLALGYSLEEVARIHGVPVLRVREILGKYAIMLREKRLLPTQA
ncbi:ASCH domain-containing protein [Infirmifilum lucidum]|uniref:ASCH domain-containing protein n=1 Tax=Infirmifilum lucidum TaxID=2776706 RepID=A0A7L9FL06_9CREN|nr:ASCH domain-containing protein [Infirmifilum lucidum]QOJ79505.1 ASCH domain-containing protein [Infirmifilum lucidum]